MADDMNDEMVMDLDLNQEPLLDPSPPPPFGYGPLLNELETAHGRIEDRIRQLEAVTARARQRQRWRQARNNPELSYMTVIEQGVGAGNENQGGNGVVGGDRVVEGIVNAEERAGYERGRNSKRDISQLAKALEMDLDSKKTDNGGGGDDDSGGFFDCNICFDMARDPILTCCGHLFCWSCFYQLSYVDSSAKECPVCKGEVTDSSITPIYGNGKNQPVLKLETGVKIPPRPRAHRVESIRQQRVFRGISHIPVAEALRRIRIGIGSIGENPLLQGLNSVGPTSETNPSLHSSEAGGSRRHRSRHFSRVISESAASLSSISSALNNAERLVEDLETYINDRLLRRVDAQILPNNQERNTFLASTADIQPEPQNAEMNLTVPLSSSSSQRAVATTVVQLDNLSTSSAVEIDLTISHPSSSSRRTAVSRTLSLEGGASRELRRRRLR
ncbi:Zinc finger, RING/FYVE/PHD-type [Cynara cardunculus var. scolymus]|uniref:E3 ubiquitin-protein ligase RMA n=2 Tax=Cynara cardunculus var. scolymus TaxID=59895 RepID=A0A103XBN2_CYNCS|nr:Zinc finger, RING/FYVE/PHD-type [Cynara cardunculus var. scolymus]